MPNTRPAYLHFTFVTIITSIVGSDLSSAIRALTPPAEPRSSLNIFKRRGIDILHFSSVENREIEKEYEVHGNTFFFHAQNGDKRSGVGIMLSPIDGINGTPWSPWELIHFSDLIEPFLNPMVLAFAHAPFQHFQAFTFFPMFLGVFDLQWAIFFLIQRTVTKLRSSVFPLPRQVTPVQQKVEMKTQAGFRPMPLGHKRLLWMRSRCICTFYWSRQSNRQCRCSGKFSKNKGYRTIW